MYCPKCSQQQVSDDMRFCSRCGFSLTAVRELIDSGAALVPGVVAQADQLARREKGIRIGASMMLLSLVLTIFGGLLAAIDDDLAVLLLFPVLCFVIGFILVLYGVFLKGKRRAALKQPQPMMPAELSAPPRNPELSAPRVAPLESFSAHRAQTAEMVQPPSVSESTTRLLDDESDPRRR